MVTDGAPSQQTTSCHSEILGLELSSLASLEQRPSYITLSFTVIKGLFISYERAEGCENCRALSWLNSTVPGFPAPKKIY